MVSTWAKSTARIVWACAARNWRQLGPLRRGAGSMPADLRIVQTVDAATRWPRPISSPWMRRYPPPRVLPRHPQRQIPYRLRDGRSAGFSLWIGPAASHERACHRSSVVARPAGAGVAGWAAAWPGAEQRRGRPTSVSGADCFGAAPRPRVAYEDLDVLGVSDRASSASQLSTRPSMRYASRRAIVTDHAERRWAGGEVACRPRRRWSEAVTRFSAPTGSLVFRSFR